MKTSKPPSPPAPLDRARLLVIDDDPVVCELIAQIAEQERLQADTLNSANGLTVRGLEGYSMVMLDLMLPGIDGVQVMDLIKDLTHQPQLVLISGVNAAALDTAIRLAQGKGLKVDSLPKPIRVQALLALFYKHILDQAPRLSGPHSDSDGLQLEAQELLAAFKHQALVFTFQPIFSAPNGRFEGVETVVRWPHARYGELSARQFAAVLSDPRVAAAWIQALLLATIRAYRTMARKTGFSGHAYVSMPSSLLDTPHLVDMVLKALSDTGFDPAKLILQIPASGLIQGLDTGLGLQARLRLRNIQLAIDNDTQEQLPLNQDSQAAFQEIKVDLASLPNGAPHGQTDKALGAIVELAHQKKLLVVACGIQDQQALDLAHALGFDKVQGPYLCAAMPTDELANWHLLQKPLHEEEASLPALSGRLLLIEDNLILQQLYASFMARQGLQMDCASTSAIALRKPDLQDYQLLMVAGSQALSDAQQLSQALPGQNRPPLALITRSSPETQEVDLADWGVAWVMTRPVDLDRLLDQVKPFMNQPVAGASH